MLEISAIKKPNLHGAPNPPEHHIITAPQSQAGSGWASYLPSWAPSPERTRPSLAKPEGALAGFRNPWPSWHKPTSAEKWASLQWGEDEAPEVELAARRLSNSPIPPKPDATKRPRFNGIDDWPDSPGAKATRLLCIEQPDFSFPPDARAKVTWLGHASLLVQLPTLVPGPGSRPVCCLFDPAFSMRCSPSQFAGPIRSYPPPCNVDDLPPIDAVFVSHNHYDHMDRDTLVAVWRHSTDTVRFFVPLENKQLLVDWGISPDRVTEMDWWDSATLTHPTPSSSPSSLTVHCTPAQHNSFRSGLDTDSALWSSWYLEHRPGPKPDSPAPPPYRVFHAGDTGYQFHSSPSWPPRPPREVRASPGYPFLQGESEEGEEEATDDSQAEEDEDAQKFPACPAFAEIRDRIGPPDLLLLPVSVGATYAYLRSFVPLPDWINPIPRHAAGVTGANHMPPWDAVRVLRVMTAGESRGQAEGQAEGQAGQVESTPVAVAMHWGTFVTDPLDVLRTLGQLEWACKRQGVRFVRELGGTATARGGVGDDDGGQSGGGLKSKRGPWFVALNHGQSICI